MIPHGILIFCHICGRSLEPNSITDTHQESNFAIHPTVKIFYFTLDFQRFYKAKCSRFSDVKVQCSWRRAEGTSVFLRSIIKMLCAVFPSFRLMNKYLIRSGQMADKWQKSFPCFPSPFPAFSLIVPSVSHCWMTVSLCYCSCLINSIRRHQGWSLESSDEAFLKKSITNCHRRFADCFFDAKWYSKSWQ